MLAKASAAQQLIEAAAKKSGRSPDSIA